MNSFALSNPEILRQRLMSYKNVIKDQILLAKYGVATEYSDKLSHKERDIYMDTIRELFIDNKGG